MSRERLGPFNSSWTCLVKSLVVPTSLLGILLWVGLVPGHSLLPAQFSVPVTQILRSLSPLLYDAGDDLHI